MKVTAEQLSSQAAAILRAWGLDEDSISATVEVMIYADLRGIESHGVSTLTLYDEYRRADKLTLRPQPRVVRETPVTALLDGDGGLGHLPSQRAMRLACDKAAKCGVGVVSLRNSNHFGAAGAYAMMAAERGLIGFVTCATWRPGIVPTFGADAMLGTNPIAFAAPGKAGAPFCLDMATSTVAFNKVKMAAWHGKEIQPGWAMGAQGQPLTDAAAAVKSIRLTPLGGLPEMSSHKGYGLATMVEILSTTLSGSFFAATRPKEHPAAPRHNVGQFFLALDPEAFAEEGEFEEGLDSMLAALRGTRRSDENQPVLVAGDPEQEQLAGRRREGIPLSEEVRRTLCGLCEEAGAPWLLGQ
ncbi:MAG: Ldh family oxidoreductase [Verrucomicrobia bacterium]|nr:Ldh family oxidoreductase [Verrucomicrobiota bacterium]